MFDMHDNCLSSLSFTRCGHTISATSVLFLLTVKKRLFLKLNTFSGCVFKWGNIYLKMVSSSV